MTSPAPDLADTSTETPANNAKRPSPLPIRKLGVNLQQGFGRHWHGGNAFRTQFFNALSMSFPVDEQFFIDAVRNAAPLLPKAPKHAALREAPQEQLRGFIGQEATHRHIHGLCNAQLEKQGLVNRWQHWARQRIDLLQRRAPHPLHALAATCAYEHYTARLADGTLRYPRWLEGAEPEMQLLWRWHAAEETEHRSVAFDLYRAVGGNHAWRVRWFVLVSLVFVREALCQTVLNLHRDGTLWRPSTWWQALDLFWGRDGLVWRAVPAALRYLRRDFHPDHEAQSPGAAELVAGWLTAHATRFRVVR
ncbi:MULTISPECIES: metal-dependent hydrolase [unclassified Acidovorax]|uniref:metal-dependent hydrolase n=1 Tax=unclassified Acidovorax TaxID=2684926 RepID=UPI002882DBAE|nr:MULTISPECIES: metal-dependent hydrolase [unclassified Acidovorax]